MLTGITPYIVLSLTLFISGWTATKLTTKPKEYIEEEPKMIPITIKPMTAAEFLAKFDAPTYKDPMNPTLHLPNKSAKLSAEVFEKPPTEIKTDYVTPKKIKEELDKTIIGQEKAKKKICVSVSNHYKRVGATVGGVAIKKSNIMLVGPTGSGKTLIVSKLAKILGVPFTHADATSYTQAGYVGKNVEDMVKDLYRNSGNLKREAEHGIIFIDEIDKLASHYHTGFRDVGGKGVQQALLKLIESDVVSLEGGFEMDMRNVLFIFGGAFQGLAEQMRETRKETSMGFGATVRSKDQDSDSELFRQITTQDIVEFGMVPEFMGRIPTVAILEGLTEEQLVQILTEPEDAITKEYEALFEIDGIKITFEKAALELIAKEAIKMRTGARSLRSIMENVLLDTMYETDPAGLVKKVKITAAYVKKVLSGK